MAPLAEAFVRLRPDTTGFQAEAERKIGVVRIDAQLNLDTKAATAAIAKLKAATGTIRIGVTVDAAKARAELAAVDAAASKLDGRTISLRINANGSAAAMTNLAAVQAAATALSGFTVRIDVAVTGNVAALRSIAVIATAARALNAINPTVNIGGLSGLAGAAGQASSRIQLLITAGLALGPALIPVAAAAAGAILGIAASAAAGVAGLGVMALALSGVLGAVKALSAARDAASKTAATAVRQDSQMAGAADTLRSAIASLANTRASAAAGAASSARAVADAERTLASAQGAALVAQQDINRARLEARQALEDLDTSLKSNSLTLRQANLDQAAAKRELDRVLADPSASVEQRAQAQLTYDRAVHQIEELTVRQGRLQAEQQRSTKLGVDGSDQVRAATARVAEAQRGVADAERGVADARRSAAEQQRQSAFAVAQAVQAVTAAQRGMATAAATAGATAGAAMDDLNRRMADLSDAGRAFVGFMFGLRQEGLQLRQAAERGFLPGFQRGIESLLPLVPRLTEFVERLGRGMGDIAERALTGLSGAGWRPFFSYLDGTAVPTVKQLAATFGNVVTGLANMVLAFVPVQRQVGGGFAELAERFAAWSASLSSNRQFQEFLDYVLTRGPVVVATAMSLLDALVRIGIAGAPIGDVVLAALRGIGAALSAIPIPLLTALVTGFAALRIAAVVAPMVMALSGALHQFASNVAVGATSARAGAASFAAALGGPWTIAIAAAVIAIGVLMQRSAAAKAEIDRLKGALLSYSDALKDGVTPESTKAVQAILAQDDKMRALLKTVDQLGITQQTLLEGLRGDRDARREVVTAIDDEIGSLREWLEAQNGRADANSTEIENTKRRIEQLERQKEGFKGVNTAQAESNRLTAEAAREAEFLAAAGGTLNVVQRALADAHRVLADSTASAEQRTTALRVASEALHAAAITQIEGQERYSRALITARDSLIENGVHLDFNTLKALGNRDALQAVITASGDMYDADIAAGVALDIATAKHQARINTLIEEARRAGANEDEVRALIAAYDKVPGLVNTDVQTKGLDAVFRDLVNLAIAQRAIQEGISPAEAWTKYSGLYTTSHMRPWAERGNAAQGGPVRGPGGPTDDKVPAALMRGGKVARQYALSDGEWIHKAAAVDYYGPGAMAAINEMKIPREILARAQGGIVQTWPFPLDVSKALRPDISGTAGPGTGPTGAGPGFSPWPSATPGRGGPSGDSGVWRSIMALVRQSGIPYRFGNAFRRGDPLWHGAGRAVDLMGYNQDALATFFMSMRPRVLELIHRTRTRDYGITRGRISPFRTQWPLHENHIHIAMREGGRVLANAAQAAGIRSYDGGGLWPNNTLGANTSGGTEVVTSDRGMGQLAALLLRIEAAVDRVAPGVGREINGGVTTLHQMARAY